MRRAPGARPPADELVHFLRGAGRFMNVFSGGGVGDGDGGGDDGGTNTGVVWIPQGPAPATFGQVENVLPNDDTCGGLHTVVAHPTNPNILYVGGTNGGIWRTENARSSFPHWEPLIDDELFLSIGALEMDPANPSTLVAGAGLVSSFALFGGPLTGLIVTHDAGRTWARLDDPLLLGESFSGVAIRGSKIVASSNSFFGGGGVFRTGNGGDSWTRVSGTGGLPDLGAFDLVGDPLEPARLYVSIEATGIFRSDTFGETWVNITQNDPTGIEDAILNAGNNNNLEMAVSPTTGRLYAAVIDSGQPSYIGYTDDGASWTAMELPVTADGNNGSVVDASNASPIVIQTQTPHGIPFNSRVLILGVQGNAAANGLFEATLLSSTSFSLDGTTGNGDYTGGGSWDQVNGLSPRPKPGGQGFIHFSIVVDPENPDLVYVGGDRQNTPLPNFIGATDFVGRLFRGDASVAASGQVPSAQWSHLTHSDSVASIPLGGTFRSSAPHADSREMVFDAAGEIVETDDGGIYRRTAPGRKEGDWVSILGDLQVTEYHDVVYDSSANVIFGGAQDTGTTFQSFEGDPSFITFLGGDGGDVAVDDSTMDGFSRRYTSAQFLQAFNWSLWDEDNNFLDFAFPFFSVPNGAGIVPQFYTPIALNDVDQNRLILVGDNSIYESFDFGDTLEEIGPGLGPQVSPFFLDQNAVVAGGRKNGVDVPEVLYVGSFFNVFVRPDTGGPLLVTTQLPGFSLPRDLILDPEDWETLYVAAVDFGTGLDAVYVTHDGGLSWGVITGNLASLGAHTVRSIQYVPGAGGDDLIVLGTGAGTFVSLESAPDVWTEFGPNLPNVQIFDLDYDAEDDLLIAGTLGRGAWTLAAASQSVSPLTGLAVTGSEVGIQRDVGDMHFVVHGRFDLPEGVPVDPTAVGARFSFDGLFGGVFAADFVADAAGRATGTSPSGSFDVRVGDDGTFRVLGRGLDLSGLDLSRPVRFFLRVGDRFGAVDIPFDAAGRFSPGG